MSMPATAGDLGDVAYWDVDPNLMQSPAITNRNLLAQKFAQSDLDSVLRQYIKMDAQHTRNFYSELFEQLDGCSLAGTGLEVGAGICAFSAIACQRNPLIDQIYAVEIVPDVVKFLQPITIPALCPDRPERIKRIVGSFDKINLPDSSLDFCIELGSLHHSDDLTATLTEIARVRRPDAPLIAVDRAQHDALSDAQREYMLEVQYSEEWKRDNGYDSAPLTRLANGEHEIRIREWRDAFRRAGFSVEKQIELRTVSLKKLLHGAMLRLPFGLRRRLQLAPSRVRWHAGEWRWMAEVLLGGNDRGQFRTAIRDNTVFIARRTSMRN